MLFAPWSHRPPPVHRWERKFEQRERLPHRPKMRSVAPWSHCHQDLLPTQFTAPSLCSPQTSRGLLVYTAVSAEVEQLNQRGTRPPELRSLRPLACRTRGPTARGRWGRLPNEAQHWPPRFGGWRGTGYRRTVLQPREDPSMAAICDFDRQAVVQVDRDWDRRPRVCDWDRI
jgi:hypothetical protein